MLIAARHLYEFGPFRLDPAERRLTREGEPVALTPKCFDLLVVLVENGGHLLEKEELLKRVWPNQFVEESNLSFNISALRKVLGEGRNGRHYIETVPKKGFRFVARVKGHRGDGNGVAVEITPKDIEALREAFKMSGWQGFVRMRIDLLEDKSKKEYISPTILAGLYALSGEKDPAFAWLEKAIDERDSWASMIKIQPAYDNLRSDPRFTKLLQRVNLMP